MSSAFVNEPHVELRRASARRELLDALARLDERLPLSVPVLIGDDERADGKLVSLDPGDPDRPVAHAAVASEAEVDQAVVAVSAAASAWARTPATERAAVLSRAAAILRADRPRLAALEVRECAKPWAEADADVCEAIDFLEYYARAAVALAEGRELAQLPGERNALRYRPRGVVAVISPWNFPIAIPCGMVAAALATGNAVVLKPAEQSPACALALVRALRDAGVPAGALALLPGLGEVGAALARHPGVHTIAFTGSGAVGLELLRTTSEIGPGQLHLKRLVAEMGGKNCVIVDADADLDEAIPAIIRSAFGFAGQKCSAASRVLAHEAVVPALHRRLQGAVALLVVAQATDFAVDVPPVIDADAVRRIGHYRQLAQDTGSVLDSPGVPKRGYFCPPTVVCELPADSPLLIEEVFGPLTTLESVPSVRAACDAIDELGFALTGGLFSRDPSVVAEVVDRSPVGNLYVNRHTTAAMVGRQPFGGNRLSGTGAKAGGPDYLLHFVEPVVVCENTMRHGLVT